VLLCACGQMAHVRNRVLSRGFAPEQLSECLSTYEGMNVWHVSGDRAALTFVHGRHVAAAAAAAAPTTPAGGAAEGATGAAAGAGGSSPAASPSRRRR
jgi:hypothetical protein